jgi:hypothetical protein
MSSDLGPLWGQGKHNMAQAYPQNIFTYDLIDRAEEFNTAYHSLGRVTKRIGPDLTRYFLLSQSIELALKAFIALHGKTAKELRNRKNFGHGLNKLLIEALKFTCPSGYRTSRRGPR